MRGLKWGMLSAVLAAATGLADAGGPAKVDIRGGITQVNTANAEARLRGIVGSLLIEGKKEKDTSYDKASVKVTDKTAIKKMVGKDRKDAKFEDLKAGAKVTATFIGPVAESYPVQATAREIVILEEAK